MNQWGRVLHDDDLEHAIVDRVLERGCFLTLDGPSMRTKHLDLDDPTSPEASSQRARISGTHKRAPFQKPVSWCITAFQHNHPRGPLAAGKQVLARQIIERNYRRRAPA